MLSGIASYFLNAPPTPTTEDDLNYRTMEAEDDWLLVDVAEGSDTRTDPPPVPEQARMVRETGQAVPSGLPTPLFVGVVDSASASPTEVTPPSSPCPMDGSWYVTPPPCFVARRPVHLETSPLENLLIEHPSMSVYGPCSRIMASHKFRSMTRVAGQGGVDQLTPPPSPPPALVSPDGHAAEVLTTTGRSFPGPRPSAIAARAGWLEQLQGLRPAQRAQGQREQRHLRRSQLERQNRVAQAGNRHPKRRDRAATRRSGANNNRKCCC